MYKPFNEDNYHALGTTAQYMLLHIYKSTYKKHPPHLTVDDICQSSAKTPETTKQTLRALFQAGWLQKETQNKQYYIALSQEGLNIVAADYQEIQGMCEWAKQQPALPLKLMPAP